MNRKIDRISLYHMRKAGGTSLRRYTQWLCSERSLQHEVIEGPSLDPDVYFKHSEHTLFFTSIRDPLARIRSSYLFEGRWHMYEEERRSDNAKSFENWLAEIATGQYSPELWFCNSNYFIKCLIGYPARGKDGIGEAELQLAKEVLNRFDIVLITEWMPEQITQDYLDSHLHCRQQLPRVTVGTACENPEEPEEDVFPGDLLEKVRLDNALDYRIYEYAMDLCESRIRERGLDFPAEIRTRDRSAVKETVSRSNSGLIRDWSTPQVQIGFGPNFFE